MKNKVNYYLLFSLAVFIVIYISFLYRLFTSRGGAGLGILIEYMIFWAVHLLLAILINFLKLKYSKPNSTLIFKRFLLLNIIIIIISVIHVYFMF